MKALKNYTIPQLITHLNWLGVEWVGAITRKAPILVMIERFAYNADYTSNDKEAEMIAKGLLNGQGYPVCNLVGFIRYMGQVVTSDELADLETLQERAKGLATKLIKDTKPPTVAKVVAGTTMNQLSQKPASELREYCKVLGMKAPFNTAGSDQADKCNMLYYLKNHIAAYNRDFTRNLTLDLENCHKAYDTSSMSLKVLPSNISEYPREYIRPNGTFLHHVVKNMMTRGFHEPDISFNSPPAALYFCCDLADNPNPTPFKKGDKVTLKPRELKVWVKGMFDLYWDHGVVAEVIAVHADTLAVSFKLPDTKRKFTVTVNPLRVDRVLEGSEV